MRRLLGQLLLIKVRLGLGHQQWLIRVYWLLFLLFVRTSGGLSLGLSRGLVELSIGLCVDFFLGWRESTGGAIGLARVTPCCRQLYVLLDSVHFDARVRRV